MVLEADTIMKTLKMKPCPKYSYCIRVDHVYSMHLWNMDESVNACPTSWAFIRRQKKNSLASNVLQLRQIVHEKRQATAQYSHRGCSVSCISFLFSLLVRFFSAPFVHHFPLSSSLVASVSAMHTHKDQHAHFSSQTLLFVAVWWFQLSNNCKLHFHIKYLWATTKSLESELKWTPASQLCRNRTFPMALNLPKILKSVL